VYVALSRCTSMAGMVLHSRIQHSSLFSDERITHFSRQQANTTQQLAQLENEKRRFQNDEIVSLFDFSTAVKQLQNLLATVSADLAAFNKDTLPWLIDTQNLLEKLQVVAIKFSPQLQQLLNADPLPENNAPLQQRLVAAANHFCNELQQIAQRFMHCPIVSDSKQIAADFNKPINDCYRSIVKHQYLFEGCKNGFTAAAFQQHKIQYVKPQAPVNIYAGKTTAALATADNPHPLLHQQLRKLRDTICEETSLPVYRVANSKTLSELCQYLPQTYQELAQISGFGQVRVKQMGERFLSIISEYCDAQNLHSNMMAKMLKKEKTEKKGTGTPKDKSGMETSNTRTQSLQLFLAGKSIAEIATERNFAVSTIEGHLSHFIGRGELDVNRIISADKQQQILQGFEKYGTESLKPIVESSNHSISYGEARMMLADRNRKMGNLIEGA
jgi:hypothetical protein